jgi:MEMO1 family protein
MVTRPAAVAGTWYPGRPDALAEEIDGLLARARPPGPGGDVLALVAPHAGLMFSGGVGAHAYRAVSGQTYDLLVLVGPSHFAAFEGVALFPGGAFDTPLGPVPIDPSAAAALAAFPVIRPLPAVHQREHALEMQLPFVRRLFPDTPMVPLLIGSQNRPTIVALADALAETLADRRPLLVASTDLSHYYDAKTAGHLDGRVAEHLDRFDPEGLLALYESYPESERGRSVACGAAAAIAVMRAARALGATSGRVLAYAHSGEVSGDYEGVVGYIAAAFARSSGEGPSC